MLVGVHYLSMNVDSLKQMHLSCTGTHAAPVDARDQAANSYNWIAKQRHRAHCLIVIVYIIFNVRFIACILQLCLPAFQLSPLCCQLTSFGILNRLPLSLVQLNLSICGQPAILLCR